MFTDRFKSQGKFLLISLSIIVLISTQFLSYKVKAEINKKNIVILLDNSGSMNNPQTRIGDLAKVAGSMILDSIKEEEVNISIITFGEKVTVLKSLNEEKNLDDLKVLLNEVSLDEGGTNVKDGIEVALDELRNFTDNKSIIILSDGKEDPLEGLTEEHKNELSNLIENAAKENIKINTIALSDDVDSEFLSNVASNTDGLFREGKTADKLFQSLTTIIGEENDFINIENYTTDAEKSKDIILSSSVEEVIINVAACDNKKPNINVKLNNKIIEPLKSGDMYYVYRFSVDSKNSSALNINSLGDEVSSVIVQFKSKAKINMVSDLNKYISLPRNVPIDIRLSLECSNEENIEGNFIECSNGQIISANEQGIFNHSFSSNEVGENIIRYTAKDNNNGIIAVLEITINVNNYPPFYYDDIQSSIIVGDSLKLKISLKDKVDVDELSGEIIIKQGNNYTQIPLEVKGEELVGEVCVNETKDISYYANIRGKTLSDGGSFAYPLPTISLKVKERPIINIGYKNKKKEYIVKSKVKEIKFEILEESVIDKDTKVKVYDSKNNELGSFYIKAGQTDSITTKIIPKEEEKNLTLFFESDNGIETTKKIVTNLNVCSNLGIIFKNIGRGFVYIVIPILIVITIIAIAYIILIQRYKNEVENYEVNVSIDYRIKPNGRDDSISGKLSRKKNKLYINVDNNYLALDSEPKIDIGYLKFINEYQDKLKIIQGLYSFIKNEKIFRVEYRTTEEMYTEDFMEIKDTSIIYGRNKKIVYKIGKKVIEIYV